MRAGRVSERWGSRLQAARAGAHISQQSVAGLMKQAGFPWHAQTVSEVESGNRVVSVDEAEILEALFALWERQAEEVRCLLSLQPR